jgi:flagellar hook-associated protein 2
MSGISSSTGLISGLNTGQLIDQLLAVEARPRAIIQRRVLGLQQQSAAVLDINGRLSSLRSAARSLFDSRTFQSTRATSSSDTTLAATASTGAAQGSYTFLVDRTVSTQQFLTRAYGDRNSTSLGLTSLTVEPTTARLDTDTALAALNGGQGVSRGKITITDRGGLSANVDLSRAATINDVLTAINQNGTARVSASVSGGRLVLTDSSGGTGSLVVASQGGYTTAESLGINGSVAATTITGTEIYRLGDETTIASLRDGAGIRFNTSAGTATADFTLTTRDGSSFQIDIGDQYGTDGARTAGPVGNIRQLRERIETQTSGKATVQVRPDGRGIRLVDNTTGGGNFSVVANASSGAADDLGIVQSTTDATIDSSTLLAGLNSTLSRLVPVQSRDNDVTITTRSGENFTFTLDFSGSVTDILQSFSTATGGKIRATLAESGNRLVLTDTTTGSTNLTVAGGGATTLGVATAPSGVGSSTVSGTRVQRQYVELSTKVASLNGGQGIGTGTFRVIGSGGRAADIIIGSDVVTVDDLLKRINNQTSTTGVRAALNDTGTGIKLEEDPSASGGGVKISVSDSSGTVARALNIAQTAPDVGTSNVIDGSFRRSVTLSAADTLDQVVTKINAARPGIAATVVTDGSSGTPFRLRLTSTQSGQAGRFLLDTVGADLGATTVTQGNDARLFFGSEDPARAILVTRPTNSVDGLIDGLRVDVRSSSPTPVTVTVARNNEAITQEVQRFVDAFNSVAGRLDSLTSTDPDGTNRGALVGDSTSLSLRQELFGAILGRPLGVSGQFRNLSQIGLNVGRDGTLALDSTKLQAALDLDPTAVADLLAARVAAPTTTTTTISPGITTPNTGPATFTSLGVAERIARIADRYLDSVNGLLTGSARSITETIDRNNRRIDEFTAALERKRERLQFQFGNLETTLARLQSQQSALSRISTLNNTNSQQR